MISREAQEREAIWTRQVHRMRVGLSAANVTGALTMYVFLRLLVPIPSKLRHDTTFLWLNVGLFVIVGVVEECTRATGDTVLVSERTRALLSDASFLEERPELPLKSKSETVALYAPPVTPPSPASRAPRG